jgi:DNA-binding MarR family transcriptional regulator
VPSSALSPDLVAWTRDRDTRGAAPDRGARCTVAACPVRWASGPSRPCPDHRTQLSQHDRDRLRAALAIARTPGRKRAVGALLRDFRRTNAVIARDAGVDHMTVCHARHELEAAGLIAVYRAPSRSGPRSLTALQLSIRRALLRDPARSNRAIAAEVATNHVRVREARQVMERAGQIPAYRSPQTRHGYLTSTTTTTVNGMATIAT